MASSTPAGRPGSGGTSARSLPRTWNHATAGASEPSQQGSLQIEWLTDRSRLGEMTQFFVSGVHDGYMSHGDMMEGRADGPGRWSERLEERHSREISGVQLTAGRFDQPGERIVVAEVDGELIGYAFVALVRFDSGVGPPVIYARLDDIVVAAPNRGRGYGSRMIEWIEGQLRDAEVPRLFLETSVANSAARRLYERHGFITTSAVMLKEL